MQLKQQYCQDLAKTMECLKTQSEGNWKEWGEQRGNKVEMKGKHKGCGEQGQ